MGRSSGTHSPAVDITGDVRRLDNSRGQCQDQFRLLVVSGGSEDNREGPLHEVTQCTQLCLVLGGHSLGVALEFHHRLDWKALSGSRNIDTRHLCACVVIEQSLDLGASRLLPLLQAVRL